MSISLCMIVGNEEAYIDRVLTSFAPLADEICIVRAIGNQKPDKTLEIAVSKFNARTQVYVNKAANADWPHVDDFAAARQQSFDMASHEFCFWCDADDILENPEEAARIIRSLPESGITCGFKIQYNIFGKGISLPRERLILKRSGKWQGAVHEFFNFYEPSIFGPLIDEPRVTVTHLPHETKGGSRERNLRILGSLNRDEMSTGLLYHLHLELLLSGRMEESLEVAKLALAKPDIGRAERFEIFINLAQKTDDPNTKESFLHQAYIADPRRREALALLANNAMNFGEPEIALAYTRQMMATAEPKEKAWNSRTGSYSWVGTDIHSQALRANGFVDEAETLRRRALNKAGGPTIALIHATRGRPEQACRCRKTWLMNAEHPERIEHIFVIDSDDVESRPLRRLHHIEVAGDGGCVAAWNSGALATEAPILLQLSDDWTPPPKWDTLILERFGGIKVSHQWVTGLDGKIVPGSEKTNRDEVPYWLTLPRVLAVSDGSRQDKLLCMAICTRAYMCQDYFLFHPWFKGVYSDDWFTSEAYRRGQVIEARDLVFRHDHPAFHPSVPIDETYQRQNSAAAYEQGLEVLNVLKSGKEWSTIPGFFNYWQFYDLVAHVLKDGDEVAEIGVWLGRSIIYLAQALQRQGKHHVTLHAVDTFKGADGEVAHEATVKANGGSNRTIFEENLKRCGVDRMVKVHECESALAATNFLDKSMAFVWIDAAHDYASVCADIKAWEPKVKKGGILAGHDAQDAEVMRAVKDSLPNHKVLGCLWVKQ